MRLWVGFSGRGRTDTVAAGNSTHADLNHCVLNPLGKNGSKGDVIIMTMPSEYMALEPQGHAQGPDINRPVDLVHLARYTMGNRSLEREVLTLFHKQCESYLQRLKEAGEDKAWADAAHTIKGSARGIGAWHVAKCAETAEALKGAARETGCHEALAELERVVDEAKGYIESLLAESEPVA